MTKEALRLALEALVLNNAEWKHLADSGDSGYWSAEDQNHYKQTEQAIAAVQRALANEALEKMAENARELGLDYEPAQEPVAWEQFYPDMGKPQLIPPQRKPLTDEEIEKIAKPFWDGHLGYGYADFDSAGFARAIEAKLKENT